MSLYYQCPDCGANLDPGEKCDCKETPSKEYSLMQIQVIINRNDAAFAHKLLTRAVVLERVMYERGLLK